MWCVLRATRITVPIVSETIDTHRYVQDILMPFLKTCLTAREPMPFFIKTLQFLIEQTTFSTLNIVSKNLIVTLTHKSKMYGLPVTAVWNSSDYCPGCWYAEWSSCRVMHEAIESMSLYDWKWNVLCRSNIQMWYRSIIINFD